MHQTLVVYTGGTIGMAPSENGLAPNDQLENGLRHVLAANEQIADFDFISLEPLIDSSNAQATDWQRLADTIQQHSEYSSYLVLHGTDTMAYAAAAISFLCLNTRKRIIFTGSQVPLALPNSDAADNFLDALKTRNNDSTAEGCYLAFGGKLLPANRCYKASSNKFEAFEAPNAPERQAQHVSPIAITQAVKLDQAIQKSQQHSVGVIYFYPGISADTIAAQLQAPGLKAALLLSFGAGNIPADNIEILHALQSATESGIALINISQCRHGGVNQGLYAAGNALNQIGVFTGADMQLEAAFAKAHVLIAQGYTGQELAKAMVTNLAGELSEPK